MVLSGIAADRYPLVPLGTKNTGMLLAVPEATTPLQPFEIENDEMNGRVVKKQPSKFGFRNPFLKQKQKKHKNRLKI
jgi:hypothetical protein